MNRNLVVGIVLFGLVLAGASVGVSTFLVQKDLAAAKAQAVQAPAAGTSGGSTSSAPSTPSTGGSGALGNQDNMSVQTLTASDRLWSKGPLLVSNTSSGQNIFTVDSTSGVGVDADLTVTGITTVADVASNGKVSASGLVQGSSFSNGGAFKVDGSGNVGARNLVASGMGTFNGGLAVGAGQTFQAGNWTNGGTGNRLKWDPTLGEFSVVGHLTVNSMTIQDQAFNTANIAADTFSLKNGHATLGGLGVLAVESINATDAAFSRSLSVGSTKFTVDESGNTDIAGKLNVAGDATFTGDVAFNKNLKTTNGNFTVDAGGVLSAKNTNVSGNLVVTNGDAVLNQNLHVVQDLTVDGQINTSQPLSNNTVTAHQNLRVGSSPYKFTVDSSGNTVAAGTLHVVGASTFDGAVNVGGALTAQSLHVTNSAAVDGNLTVTGDIKGANLKSGVETVSGATSAVAVSGLPANGSVIITPRFSTSGPYYAVVSAGTFTIHSADPGDFSWIATW